MYFLPLTIPQCKETSAATMQSQTREVQANVECFGADDGQREHICTVSVSPGLPGTTCERIVEKATQLVWYVSRAWWRISDDEMPVMQTGGRMGHAEILCIFNLACACVI